MEKVRPAEVLDLVAYEKVRDAMRARIVERKRNRRVAVGDNLTFLFENRDTVLFQIQEMVRTERIVHDDKVGEELDAYNALIPSAGELSATLFIEIPELARMSQDEVRRTVNRFQGLDREGVWLVAGDQRVPARFEDGRQQGGEDGRRSLPPLPAFRGRARRPGGSRASGAHRRRPPQLPRGGRNPPRRAQRAHR